ncbi:MAG: glucokinase [Herminiimonas sp.]|nr:glucokinase [Herminiimonas sp.]
MSDVTIRAGAASFPRLVADIGGSNARFGWIAAPGAAVTQVQRLPVTAHAGPAEAARTYLEQLESALGAGYQRPRHAAFAVATPVAGDRIAFTNSHWDFSTTAVQGALALDSLRMLNDFEALALALPHLQPEQIRTHAQCATAPHTHGTLAVVGPGTGLGVAGVVRTATGWLALPGEGGHATLAAGDEFESALLSCVRRRLSHVSAERLLSGIGLPVLHAAVCEVGGTPDGPLTAEQIIMQGLAATGSACEKTLDVFCAMLGNFAGNVALTLGARGGLYIGGGIVPRMADYFFASRFRQCFEAKGRFSGYLREVPTALIVDTLVALTGAASAIEQGVS